MKRKAAEQIIAQYREFGRIFNALTEISLNLDVEQSKLIREAAADSQAILYNGLVRTVVREYPDLQPDSDHSS